jgi:hypothetical protein
MEVRLLVSFSSLSVFNFCYILKFLFHLLQNSTTKTRVPSDPVASTPVVNRATTIPNGNHNGLVHFLHFHFRFSIFRRQIKYLNFSNAGGTTAMSRPSTAPILRSNNSCVVICVCNYYHFCRLFPTPAMGAYQKRPSILKPEQQQNGLFVCLNFVVLIICCLF